MRLAKPSPDLNNRWYLDGSLAMVWEDIILPLPIEQPRLYVLYDNHAAEGYNRSQRLER